MTIFSKIVVLEYYVRKKLMRRYDNMSVLMNLEPNRVFYYFEEISKIPHGSYHTREISDYLVRFAKEHQLKYYQDIADNVIIYKNATEGYEDAPVTILQGHMDMVCEKTPLSAHNFEKDPLQLMVDGDYISAKDTTLGGDNGIAIAYALAILESEGIAHPALEIVITSDEEVGLLGADALDTTMLNGTYMINLDSEDEGIITAGSAGGVDAISQIPLHYWEADGMLFDVTIEGLMGGHSGVDITKNRANANILMGRYLYELSEKYDYMIADIAGGNKSNAIPRICTASLVAAETDVAAILAFTELFQRAIQKEYTNTDGDVCIHIEPKNSGTYQVLDVSAKHRVLFYLRNVPNGIMKMSGQIDGLVETSTNLGIIKIEDNQFYALSGVRSSFTSARDDVGNKIQFITEFLAGEYSEQAPYPSWEYLEDSKLRKIACDAYENLYGKQPHVEVIHAGLECGLFFDKMRDLDCISIGPDMKDVHTTEERLSISSVSRTWDYLLAILKEIK